MRQDQPLIVKDSWLKPYAAQLQRRYRRAVLKEFELLNGRARLADGCNNHLYYGLHSTADGWVMREHAPNARQLYIYGDFSYWRVDERFAMHRIGDGDWEITLPREFLRHGMLYKLWMVWQDGADERIPAYCRRVVQDDETKIFSAQVWAPDQQYAWRYASPARPSQQLIYEAHVGMSSEDAKVSTYWEFAEYVVPRIKRLGYNTIQLMAVQEHPYYGSFGYQVSSFYAPSFRFGTPEELKYMIDTAHGAGLRVILDIVHSHAVNNEREGLGFFDGSESLYFHNGERGRHPVWESRCFDYGKNDTLMFLLSNLKYWQEEFHFDGFRFDGVTSMSYLDHGIGVDFLEYAQYFDANVDEDALTYLYLANRLVHQIDEQSITVAEDVSGIPGLAFPAEQGGLGFDYRMSMGISDFWTKIIKELPDEQWHVGDIYYRLTDHRAEERTVSYAESHDQSMVGDQALAFRLMGAKMYDRMSVDVADMEVDRGVALLKLIVFSTLALSDGGFLNFMGNEFGHPEWIDFPRAGNNWSYHYARRQWSLADDEHLKYHYLNAFHQSMMTAMATSGALDSPSQVLVRDIENQILAFSRGSHIFVFNFSPARSQSDFPIYCATGRYRLVLNGDAPEFGGFGRVDSALDYDSVDGVLKVYIPSRTALMFSRY